MTVLASLCNVRGESVEMLAPPSAERIRALVAEHAGFGLVEPDLPLGKLTLPRDPIDRAVLAIVTRGRFRELLFVRGANAKLAPVKAERALDFTVTLVEPPPPSTDALFSSAFAALAEHASLPGNQLLREVRARRGSASTKDSADLGRLLVRAWSAGLVELG